MQMQKSFDKINMIFSNEDKKKFLEMMTPLGECEVVVTFVKSYDRIMKHVREESAEILKMYDTLNKQYAAIAKKYNI